MNARVRTWLALVASGLLTFGACDTGLSEGGGWQAWNAVEGELRPEVNLGEYAGDVRDRSIRVVTFNVEYGDDIARIAETLATHPDLSRADVILVQEIESYASEGLSRAAFLAQRLQMNHVYAPSKREGEGTQGLAILSRFPLAHVERMQLPVADFRIGPQQRIAIAASLQIGEKELRVIDVHLDVRLSIAQRIEQLHPVTVSAEGPVAIAGDFNTNPYFWAGSIPIVPDQIASDSDQAEMLDDYMRAYGYDTPTAESGTTQDSGVGLFRLDSIYTRELRAQTLGVARDLALSDHSPLWLDLAWP